MSFDFPWILTTLTLMSGIIWLVDKLFFAKARKSAKLKEPVILEYAISFFPVFLIVLLIRSFLIQPYTVPTGSLEPTVMPGDYLLVNEFQYGLHLPVWRTKILPISEPKVGEIALFQWPVNRHVTFIKRVIGVPGDRISYINKVLYINGKKATQKFVKQTKESGGERSSQVTVDEMQENLNGVKHLIDIEPNAPSINFKNLVVPKGKYFMMGDNRDNSDDSRFWGFVPEQYFVGKAFVIFFHKTPGIWQFDWSRIGRVL